MRSGRACLKPALLVLIAIFSLLPGFSFSTNVAGCAQLNTSDTYTLTQDIPLNYGSEVITEGVKFQTGSWSIGFAITINNESKWTTDSTNGYLRRTATTVDGARYEMSIAGNTTSGQVLVGGGGPTYVVATLNAPEFNSTFNFTASGTTITLSNQVVGNNVSIYDVHLRRLSLPNPCFNLTAENITLDMQGHLINGTNESSTSAVSARGLYNSTIKNGRLDWFQDGIFLNASRNSTIQNMTANTVATAGIAIRLDDGTNGTQVINASTYSISGQGIGMYRGSNRNTISNSTGSSLQSRGLFVSASHNNTLNNSKGISTGSGYGISLSGALDNKIDLSNGTTNTGYGIALESTSNQNTITNTNATSTASFAVYLASASGNQIVGGLYRTATDDYLEYAIEINTGSSNLIENNTISTSAVGPVYITGTASSNTVKNNSISASYVGIGAVGSSISSTYVGFNHITSSGDVCVLGDSAASMTVVNNVLSCSREGFQFGYTSNHVIENNTISVTGGAYDGIELVGTSGYTVNSSRIINNTITGTTGNGIYLFANGAVMGDHWIERNSINVTSGSAIRADYVDKVNITNNTLRATSGYGILISGSNYTQLINNTAVSSSGFGAWSLNSLRNNITGGLVSSSTGRAALNVTGSSNSIFRNITINSSTTCINISSTSENNSFFYNELYNCTTYIENYNSNNTFNSSQPLPTFPQASLAAAWKFDGNALDDRGLINGTINSGITNATGMFGGGYRFDGLTGNITLASNPVSLAGDFTVSLWINSPAHANDRFISLVPDSNNGFQFITDQVSGKYAAALKRSGANTINGLTYGAFASDLNNWTHIAYVVSGSTGTFYRNGVAVASDGSVAVGYGSATAFSIGSRSDNFETTQFNGTMDHVGIWSKALSASEVSALYRSQQGNFYQNIRGLRIYDSNNDNYGDLGEDYPLSASVSGSNWTGLGTDWGPIGATVDTTALAACANLSTAGAAYELHADITAWAGQTCFNITNENITLDLQGHYLNGSNTTNTYGIYSNQLNSTIKNARIENFSTGVYFDAADNGTINNITAFTSRYGDSTGGNGHGMFLSNAANWNTITNSNSTSNRNGTGIYLYTSSNNSITYSNFTTTSSAGIALVTSSNNNTIINSTGTANSGIGIYLSSSSNNTIINSTGTSTSGQGVYLYSSSNNNTIIDSRGISTSDRGIYLYDSTNNNQIINSKGNSSSNYGITLNLNAKYNKIIGSNGTSGSGDGIYFVSTSYSEIINSTGTSTSGKGIYLHSTSNFHNITNSNGTSSSSYGIYISTSSQSSIIRDSRGVSTSEIGFILDGSSDSNIINGSSGVSTSGTGMYMSGSYNNQIINSNGTSSTSGYGIRLDTSSYNKITNSKGSSNSIQAIYFNEALFNNLTGSTGISNTSNGIWLNSANNSTIINSTGISNISAGISFTTRTSKVAVINSTGISASNAGILLYSGANGNTFTNPTGISSSNSGFMSVDSFSNNVTGGLFTTVTGRAALNITGSNSSIFRNITINSSTTCINISSTSWNNSFFYNELYNCTTYVENYNSNNTFNTTSGAVAQGNFYQNIRGLRIYDSDSDNYGDSGEDYPISASISGSNWTGLGSDWGPIGATVDTTSLQSCKNLSTVGAAYELHADITSWAGQTCFNITAENITLDLQGHDVNGTNASNAYGVYSNQLNTTVKNGKIKNFSIPVYYHNADSGRIDNITANTTYAYAFPQGNAFLLHAGASYNTISSSRGSATSGFGILVYNNNADYNNITDFNGTSISQIGIGIDSSSNYNIIRNSRGTSTSGYGINFFTSTNNILNASTGTSSSSSGINLEVTSTYNQIISSSGTSTSGYGIYLTGSSNSNNITNSNGTSSTGGSASGLYIDAGGSNNRIDGGNYAGPARGIYLKDGANYSIITGVSISSTAGQGLLIRDGSSYNNVSNSTINISGSGDLDSVLLLTNTFGNIFSGNTIDKPSGTVGDAIKISSNADSNVFADNKVLANNDAIRIELGSDFNNFTRNNATSIISFGLLSLDSNSNNISFGSIKTGTGRAALNITGSNSSIFRNITINSSKTCINISSTSWNNSFFYNELYNCTTYIENYNSNNTFNITSGAVAQGNYYQNIRGLRIYDSDSDNYGDSGEDYPISASISGSNWTGLGSDWGPIGATVDTTSLQSCKNLSTVGAAYELHADITSWAGITCFNITNENITLDMQGHDVNGTNESGKFAVYSNKLNSTVKNGKIALFGVGVFWDGADNGTIDNITANMSQGTVTEANGYAGGIFIFNGANFNTIKNSYVRSQLGYAILLDTNANNNTIINSTGISVQASKSGINLYQSSDNTVNFSTGIGDAGNGLAMSLSTNNRIWSSNSSSTSNSGILLSASSSNTLTSSTGTSSTSIGIYLVSSSNGNTITNSTGTSTSNPGIDLAASSNNQIINSNGTSASGYGILLYSSANNNQIINSTARSSSTFGFFSSEASGNNVTGGLITTVTGRAALNITGSNSSIFRNITLNSSTTCINISSTSSSNQFFYNELYNCTTYIENYNAGNYFNTTNGTTGFGNYYQNIQGLRIYDSNGNNYGDSGVDYPLNASTAGGNFSGLGTGDWGPIGALGAGSFTCTLSDSTSGDCTSFTYGQVIANITMTCPQNATSVTRVSYLLTNQPDASVLINQSNATFHIGTQWILQANYTLNDSGNFNVSALCVGTTNEGFQRQFVLPWGHLNATIVSHSANSSVIQNAFFTFTARATCTGGECGGINATLDPIELPGIGEVTILDDIGKSLEGIGKNSDEAGKNAGEAGKNPDEAGKKADGAGKKSGEAEAEKKIEEFGRKTEDAIKKAEEFGRKADEAGKKAEEAGKKAASVIDSLSGFLSELQSYASQVGNMLASLTQSEFDQKKAELDSRKANIEAGMQEALSSKGTAEAEYETLKSARESAKSEYNSLISQKKETQALLNSLEKDKSSYTKDANSLSKKITSLQKQKESKEESLAKEQEKKKPSQEKIGKLQEEIQEIENEIEEKSASLSQAQESLSSIQPQIDSASSLKGSLSAQLASKKAQVEQIQEQLKEKAKEINGFVKTYNGLKKELKSVKKEIAELLKEEITEGGGQEEEAEEQEEEEAEEQEEEELPSLIVDEIALEVEPLQVQVEIPTTGNLSISSTPDAASIYLDNQNQNQATNYTFTNLTEANYSLRLAKAGYENYTATVEVIAGAQASVSATLTQIQAQQEQPAAQNQTTGSLSISSNPSPASIYLDSIFQNQTTNYTFQNLAQGNYSIKLNASGFENYTGTTEVLPGTQSNISASLTQSQAAQNASQPAQQPAQQQPAQPAQSPESPVLAEPPVISFELENGSNAGNYTVINLSDGTFNINFTKNVSAGEVGGLGVQAEGAAEIPLPSVELFGVNSSELNITIDNITDEIVATDVVAVEVEQLDSAEITLPTEQDINQILYCPAFDITAFECPAWQNTEIPFVQYSGYVTFNVSSFSAYAGGLVNESFLQIWDETESRMPYGGKSRQGGQQIKFMANLTTGGRGTVIGPAEANCTVQFKNYTDSDALYTAAIPMSYNSTSALYENHTTINQNGSYLWKAACNSSLYGYANTTDALILPTIKSGAISTTVGAIPFYTVNSNPNTTCTSLKKDQSCTFYWSINATGNLFSTHALFAIFNTTNYSANVSSNQTETINITISVNDQNAPSIVDTGATPKAAANGSDVYLLATVTDDLQVDRKWANVTLPNSSTVSVASVPGIFVPTLHGRHNVTFYANDTSGNSASAGNYFTVSEHILFNFSTITHDLSGVSTNFTLYVSNTTTAVNNTGSGQSFRMDAGAGVYDIKAQAFGSEFNITFQDVNLSNASGANLTLDRLTYQQDGHNFKGGVVFATSLNFSSANLNLSYGWLNLTSLEEDNMVLLKCPNWNAQGRACQGSWREMTRTWSKGKDSINFTETMADPAYIIEIRAYCGDTSCNAGETCSSCSADCGQCPDQEHQNAFGLFSQISCAGGNSRITVQYAGSPVEGASYTLRYTGSVPSQTIASGTTDGSGQIEFTPEQEGPYSLYLSKGGFTPLTKSYEVSCSAEEASCASDADCQGGYACRGGSCVQEIVNQTIPEIAQCVKDSECETGKICVAGSCQVPQCAQDSDCSDDYSCVEQRCAPVGGTCGYAQNHAWVSYECCSSLECRAGEECVGNECRLPPAIVKAEAERAIESAKEALNSAKGRDTRAAFEQLNTALIQISEGNYEAAVDSARAARSTAINAPEKSLLPSVPKPEQIPYYSILFGAGYALVLFGALSAGSLLALMLVLLRRRRQAGYAFAYPELFAPRKEQPEAPAPEEPLIPKISIQRLVYTHPAAQFTVLVFGLALALSIAILALQTNGTIVYETGTYLLEIDAAYAIAAVSALALAAIIIYLSMHAISGRGRKAQAPEIPAPGKFVQSRLPQAARVSLPKLSLETPKLSIPKASFAVPRIFLPSPSFSMSLPKLRLPKISIPRLKLSIPKISISLPKLRFKVPQFRFPQLRLSIPQIRIPAFRISLPKLPRFTFPKLPAFNLHRLPKTVPSLRSPVSRTVSGLRYPVSKPKTQDRRLKTRDSGLAQAPSFAIPRIDLVEIAFIFVALCLFAFSVLLIFISSLVGSQPIFLDAQTFVIELNSLAVLYGVSLFGIFVSISMLLFRKSLASAKTQWLLVCIVIVALVVIFAASSLFAGTSSYSVLSSTALSSMQEYAQEASGIFASMVGVDLAGPGEESQEIKIPLYPVNQDSGLVPANRLALSPFNYVYYIRAEDGSGMLLDGIGAGASLQASLAGNRLEFSSFPCGASQEFSPGSLSLGGQAGSRLNLCVRETYPSRIPHPLEVEVGKDALYLIQSNA